MTANELAQRFGLSRRVIRKYVEIGLLPPPTGGKRFAVYDPICVKLLEQLQYLRDYHYATLAELAERRQLTGQLLPPPGPAAP